jgi:hypothetical protein
VSFCLAAPPAFVVFEAPASGVERISDRYINILLFLLKAHNEITSRNAQADSDIEEASAPMVVVGTVHPDPAVLNMPRKLPKFGGPLPDLRLNRLRRSHVKKPDTQPSLF